MEKKIIFETLQKLRELLYDENTTEDLLLSEKFLKVYENSNINYIDVSFMEFEPSNRTILIFQNFLDEEKLLDVIFSIWHSFYSGIFKNITEKNNREFILIAINMYLESIGGKEVPFEGDLVEFELTSNPYNDLEDVQYTDEIKQKLKVDIDGNVNFESFAFSREIGKIRPIRNIKKLITIYKVKENFM